MGEQPRRAPQNETTTNQRSGTPAADRRARCGCRRRSLIEAAASNPSCDVVVDSCSRSSHRLRRLRAPSRRRLHRQRRQRRQRRCPVIPTARRCEGYRASFRALHYDSRLAMLCSAETASARSIVLQTRTVSRARRVRTRSGGIEGAIRTVKVKMVPQFFCPAVLEPDRSVDHEDSPAAGFQSELRRPVGDLADGIGEGRVKAPLDVCHRIKRFGSRLEPDGPVPPVPGYVLLGLADLHMTAFSRF